MANSNRLLLLLTMLALAITIITASSSSSFSKPDLSYAQSLGNIKDLSIDATDAHDPQVLVSGSNIYAIWVDFVTGNDDIYFKRSIDRGASFGDTINLSNNPGDSYNFKVSLSGNYIYIVWQDETLSINGTDDIFFKRSTDGGASFGDTINLSNDTGDSTDSDIASSNDGGTYVVWRDDTAGTEQILFQRSSNNGASFETGLSEHLTLSNNTVKNIDAIEPQIASDKSNVYIIWSQGNFDQGLTDVFFKRSTDGGAAFDDMINLSNNPNSQTSLPTIALLDNDVYTVWSDGPFNNGEVYYMNSADGGASFGDTINLSNDTGDSIRPEIAVSDSNVFIAWQNQAMKGDNVFFKRSTDSGASFGDTLNLSNNQGNSTNPEFSVNSSSSIYTVWQNQASNNKTHDIFFKRSTDSGASFGDTLNLSNNPGDSIDPDITSANDGSAYIVWTDNYKGRSKVFFRVLG
jgi:hypothetical protein